MAETQYIVVSTLGATLMETNEINQWDLNRRLLIDGFEKAKYVHYWHTSANQGWTVEIYRENENRYANLPNIMLQYSGDIMVYISNGDWSIYNSNLTVNPQNTRPESYDNSYVWTEIVVETDLQTQLLGNYATKDYVNEGFSNLFNATVSGSNFIQINDILDTNHNIKIEATPQVKNLLTFPYNKFSGTIGSIPQAEEDGSRINIILPDGTIQLLGYAEEGYKEKETYLDPLTSVTLPAGRYTIGGFSSGAREDIPISKCDFVVKYGEDITVKNSSFTLEQETEVTVYIKLTFDKNNSYNKDGWFKRYFIQPMLWKGTERQDVWMSPVPVNVFGKNILEINENSVAGYYGCSLTEDNNVRFQINEQQYAHLSFTHLNDLLETLDGQYITFSVKEGMENKQLSIHIKYEDNTDETAYSAKGANYCQMRLNHQGRKINYFDVKMGAGGVKYTDNTTIVEELQIVIGATTEHNYQPYQPIQRYKLEENDVCFAKSINPITNIVYKETDLEVIYNKEFQKTLEEYAYSKSETENYVKNYTYSKSEANNLFYETISSDDNNEIILQDIEGIKSIRPKSSGAYALKYNGNLLPKVITQTNLCTFTNEFKLRIEPTQGNQNYAFFTVGSAQQSRLRVLETFRGHSFTLSVKELPHPKLQLGIVIGYSSGGALDLRSKAIGKSDFVFEVPSNRTETINYYQIRFYGIKELTEAVELEEIQLTFGDKVKKPFLFGDEVPVLDTYWDIDRRPLQDLTVVAMTFPFEITYKLNANKIIEKVNKKNLQTSNNYPQYFQSNLASAIAKTEKNMISAGVNGETFVLISDLHWESNSKNSPLLIKEITKELPIENTIFLGDAINGGNYDTAVKNMNEIRKSFTAASNKFLTTYGNHDNNSLNGGTKFVNNEFYTLLRKQNDYFAVYDEYTKPAYYYFDNTTTNTRFIFLDSNDSDTNTQLNWFKACVSERPHYKFLIFVHQIYNVPTGGKNNNPKTWVMTDFMKDICSYLDSISSEYNIRGIFAGHNHYDYNTKTSSGIPIVLIDCDVPNQTQTNNPHLLETVGEAAFDIVTVNYDKNTISCSRVGRGSNRIIS